MEITIRRILVTILVLMLPAGTALAQSDLQSAYAHMIASSCQIRTGDISERFFARDIKLKEKDVRIRKVQRGWKGWVRVHAVCQVDDGAIWGFADINLRSGKTICDARNWEVRMRRHRPAR